MNINDRVKVVDETSPFYNKEGTIEAIENDKYTVLVDFVPEQHKRVRQYFTEAQLLSILDTSDDDEQEYMQESKKAVRMTKNDDSEDSNKKHYNLSNLTKIEDAFGKEEKKVMSNLGRYAFDIYVADKFIESFNNLRRTVATNDKAYTLLLKKLDATLSKIDSFGRFKGVETEKVEGLPKNIDGNVFELKIGDVNSKPIRVLYFQLDGNIIVLGNIFYHKDSKLTDSERNSINQIYLSVTSSN